jgi:predicted nuclease with TOPRIM domain
MDIVLYQNFISSLLDFIIISVYNIKDMTTEQGKRITINQLAQMMQRSFGHLEGRIDKLEVRFDSLEGRFDFTEKRFDDLEVRFDLLESKIVNNHENRLSRLEDDVRIIKTKLEKK